MPFLHVLEKPSPVVMAGSGGGTLSELNMTDDDDAGPLLAIAVFETEAAIIAPAGPIAELAIDDEQVPVIELAAHLRAIAPRAVVVLPADPMPRDPEAYAQAWGAVLATLTLLGICAEVQPPITGNRTFHQNYIQWRDPVSKAKDSSQS